MKNRRFRIIIFLGFCIFFCGSLHAGTYNFHQPKKIKYQKSHRMNKISGRGFREPDMNWVNSTLSGMTLEEKAAQMIVMRQSAISNNNIISLQIGGVHINSGSADSVLDSINYLQSNVEVPIWFTADFEAGTAYRIDGGTLLPNNMALGAANDEILAASCGWVTAREAWAMGINVTLSPVVDVVTHPSNPIIGTRSFGDKPYIVSRMAGAWINGAHSEGLFTCLKHYPGHGDTHISSISSLPEIDVTERELQYFHLYPYQNLINNGFSDLIMSAHVWYPILEPGPWPCTLSSVAMTQVLRNELGYEGLTISDAFTMRGLTSSVSSNAEAAVIGVKNGLDMLLAPPDASEIINALLNAVNSGEIPLSRIDDAVKRILMAKSSIWLPEEKLRDNGELMSVLKHPDHLAIAEAGARASITSISEEKGILPLLEDQQVVCYLLNGDESDYWVFTNRLSEVIKNP